MLVPHEIKYMMTNALDFKVKIGPSFREARPHTLHYLHALEKAQRQLIENLKRFNTSEMDRGVIFEAIIDDILWANHNVKMIRTLVSDPRR